MFNIDFQTMISSFYMLANLKVMLMILIGTSFGLIAGAIPGFTATMAVALLLPFIYHMDIAAGLSLLIGAYIGGISGGLIASILLRMPGTPASVATVFDGYPMAQRGEGGRALAIAVGASFFGGMLSTFVLLLLTPSLAKIALQFGPFELTSLGIFSLTVITTLAGKSLLKGIFAGFLGIFLSCVGMDPIDARPRLNLGIEELDAGFNILPALIGLFAVSKIFSDIEDNYIKKRVNTKVCSTGRIIYSLKDYKGQLINLIRSSLIGIGLGVLPGVGPATSNVVSYSQAQSASKHPEKFGTGIPDGIIASEAANNATVGGALVPLLSMGIPGDAVTTVLLAGLMLQGMRPGPLLMMERPEIFYIIFGSSIVANFMMVVLQYFAIKSFVKLASIKQYLLLPTLLILCVVGSYALNNRIFDVIVLGLFGIMGYLAEKWKFPLLPIIIGMILGPLVEINLRTALIGSDGSIIPLFTNPISLIFMVLSVISLAFSIYQMRKKSEGKG